MDSASHPTLLMATAGECDPMELGEGEAQLGAQQTGLRLSLLINLQSEISVRYSSGIIKIGHGLLLDRSGVQVQS